MQNWRRVQLGRSCLGSLNEWSRRKAQLNLMSKMAQSHFWHFGCWLGVQFSCQRQHLHLTSTARGSQGSWISYIAPGFPDSKPSKETKHKIHGLSMTASKVTQISLLILLITNKSLKSAQIQMERPQNPPGKSVKKFADIL